MNWNSLQDEHQIDDIRQQPGYSLIFKHSTRCSVSMMAKRKLEHEADDLPEEITPYFLDLIRYRNVSNKIADDFHVHHESPQLLLIKDGECILDQSHGQISVDEVLEMITA
ncbi:MAG: bacillithiol system redox-active protein YtxJ [Mucilaginibacter polytrichastri]|nr:bacillithiol system redox-active protein YtxJ [Mucilaginibacter polytrichastri]